MKQLNVYAMTNDEVLATINALKADIEAGTVYYIGGTYFLRGVCHI